MLTVNTYTNHNYIKSYENSPISGIKSKTVRNETELVGNKSDKKKLKGL